MKLTFACLALIGALLIAVPLQAATADIFVYEVGIETCAVWTVLSEQGASVPQENGVFGYLTAVEGLKIPGNPDMRTIDIAKDAGHADGVMAMLKSFCTAHPSSTIYAAADSISDQLVQKWLKSHPHLRPSR